MRKPRISSIQNLRLFLSALVVLHHLACTYAGPNVWYYKENTKNIVFSTLLTVFIAVNQSFFMGLFFLISAHFIPKSLNTTGALNYIKSRALRLGLPLLVFICLISPLTAYTALRKHKRPLWDYLISFDGASVGPLWFLEALIIFTLFYLAARALKLRISGDRTMKVKLPNDSKILLAAVITGVLTWFIRLRFPVGWVFRPFAFQISHFLQYAVLFGMGIVAAQNNWLASISLKRAVRWFWFAQFVIVLVTPVVMALGGALAGHLDSFYGGWHWQALAYAIWEQVVGFALIMGLLGLFQHRSGIQSRWMASLSEGTYALFVIHAPVLVGLSVVLHSVRLDPFLKFIILAPVSIVVGFSLALCVRKLPYVKEVM